jgi:CheY-like chemotaxis protein
LARKILLADDSVTAQNMGRKILTDAGYEVITVNNGSAALKKITEARPDLIVLDVYMPGYSGLEVCQRVKEMRETGQIPVLLTVGKLEPFKQDEARRVRADAFIIKPFEASELLAALGKLEDKLAPARRSKESHVPMSTMADFERLISENAPRYGDEESGWKARLKIPKDSPAETMPEPEAEPPAAAAATSFGEVAENEKAFADPPAPPVPVIDRPIPAGIPQDITPDEIAAISAAAARVSQGLSVGKEFERMASQAQSSVHDSKEEKAEEAKSASSEAATQAAASDVVSHEREPRQESAAVAESEIGKATTEQGVTAVVPTQDAAPSAAVAEAGNQISAETRETAASAEQLTPEPVTVAAAVGTQEPVSVTAGSRWVAEEIPVEAQESVLVLEREMQKAYAAFAAAEHVAAFRYEAAPVDRDDEPMFATMAPPAIGSPSPAEDEVPPSTSDFANQAEPEKQPAHAAAAAAGFQEIQRPPAPPFAPAGLNQGESHHAVAAFGGPQPFGMEQPKSDDAPNPEASESDQQPGLESGSRHEPETAVTNAAAWASWKDIRESAKANGGAAGSASTSELEELKLAKGLKKDEPRTEPDTNALAAAASADSSSSADSNLASIVDSMLAELKPKLMAELAKKLDKKK